MKKYRNNGITLIALVITIIVLLILAGVTISALTGDNGILKFAAESGEKSTKERIREEIILAINDIHAESLANNEEFTMESLKDKLPTKLDITTELSGDEIIGDLENYEYTITSQYEVIIGKKIEGTKPALTYSLDTETVGATQVTITVNATISGATILNITKPDDTIESNVNQVTYTIDKNGEYVFQAEASNGRKASCTVKINTMKPTAPIVKMESNHPVLTNEGVQNVEGKVTIKYEDNDLLSNTYSEDNGATWQIYTEPFISTSTSILARSTFVEYTNIYTEINQTITSLSYIGSEAYDGDTTTSFDCSSRTVYYLPIDSSIQGQDVYVKFTARRYSEWHFTFFNDDDEEVGTWPVVIAPWNEGYQDGNLTVPSGATKLQVQYRGGNGASGSFFEIGLPITE